jgi:transposase
MAASQQVPVELKHKYNAIPIEEMRREYFEEGLSCKQIGKRHGKSSHSWAAKWLTRFGYLLRPTGNPKGPQYGDRYPVSTEELVQLCVVRGLSAPMASKHLAASKHPASGITGSAIHRRLKKAGYRLPKGNRRCKVSLEAMIVNYVEKKLPLREVARIEGVSLGTAQNRFRELGIQLRRRTDGTQITLARKRTQREADHRELQQFRSTAMPKRRGRRKGSLLPDTEARIKVISIYLLRGVKPYQIAPHAYPAHARQKDAWNALKQCLEDHGKKIEQMQVQLSRLSDSEREAVLRRAENVLKSPARTH